MRTLAECAIIIVAAVTQSEISNSLAFLVQACEGGLSVIGGGASVNHVIFCEKMLLSDLFNDRFVKGL